MTSAAKPDYAARLKEIRERCDAATPGPWRVRMWGGTNQETPEPPEWTIDGPGGIPVEAHDCYPGDGRDVYFMGHAREDMPFLLDLIKRYERERDAVLARANNYEDSQGAMLSSLVVADELRAIYADAQTTAQQERKGGQR